MKPNGAGQMAEPPSGWATADLNDLGTLYCGQSPPSASVNNRGEGTPYVSGPEQWDGSALHLEKWTTEPRHVVPEGSVFLTVKGAGVGTVFPGARAAIGRDIYAYSPALGVSGAFLTHVLRFTAAEVVSRAQGDIPGLSRDHILDHRIPLPPSVEQGRIADALDEVFSDLDDGVAALQCAHAKLDLYRASILKAAVEGELTAEWRQQHPDTEPAYELLKCILAERRRRWEQEQLRKFEEKGQAPPQNARDRYKDPAPPDTRMLATPPKGWCWAGWNQVGESQNGRAFPSREYQSSGIKLLRPGNLHASGAVVWTEQNTRFLPQNYRQASPDLMVGMGELIINLTAQSLKDDFLGRVCITSEGECCLLNQRLARLTPYLIDRRFMLYALRSRHFRQFVSGLNTGSLIQHMFTSQIENFVFPLPPLAEQAAIVELVEDQLSVVDHLEAEIDAKLAAAQSLRQSILRHAFTGQLVPQDPNDEPASELLKRIAAERVATAPTKKKTAKPPR